MASVYPILKCHDPGIQKERFTMVRVLSVEEGGRGVRPVSAQAARSLEVQAESAPTAIEPDTITMHATVTLLVEVTQER
jgi:uncharacterized protein YggE